MDVNVQAIAEASADTSPDAGEVNVAALEERASPVPLAEYVGPFHVVVTRETWKTLQAHAGTRLDVEVGGVLLGGVYRDEAGQPFLLIDGGVPALAAESRASNVTFTAAAWTRIHEAIDRDHPGATIVGWYHTHPNFGIFLSEMDVFIQRHFFDLPHQVAIVIDPVARTHGSFIWRAGVPTPTPTLVSAAAALTPLVDAPASPQAVGKSRNLLTRAVANRIDTIARLERAQWVALAALLLMAAALLGTLFVLAYEKVSAI